MMKKERYYAPTLEIVDGYGDDDIITGSLEYEDIGGDEGEEW